MYFSPFLAPLFLGYFCLLIGQSECSPRKLEAEQLRSKLFGGGGANRAINGEDARQAEFPWIVSYRYRKANNRAESIHNCGGTLINATHFVTAAHCAKEADTAFAIAEIGTWRISNRSEGAHQQLLELKKITPYGYYDPIYLAGDVSIVEFATPAILSEFVKPLRLAPPDANPLGQICTAIGWGKILNKTNPSASHTSENCTGPNYEEADILQKVDLRVITDEECKERARYIVTPGMVCAVSPDPKKAKGICQGDSGGTLICYDKDGPYFAGITSWSHPKDCGNPKEASGFIRVSEFLEFIKNNVSTPIDVTKYRPQATIENTSTPPIAKPAAV